MENHDEQAKQQPQQQQQQQQQASKQLTFDQLQVDSDHAFAIALQEQESTFTMLETIRSDSDDESEEEELFEEETGSSSSHDFDGNFDTQEFYDEIEFLEEDEEGSFTADEIEEDDIDPDEMTYEELIALGEVVGEESRGLSIEEITSSLSSCVHKFVECKTTIDRCVICQIEYEEGEQLAALHCQHPFHTDCINQWLQIKKVCPICSIEIAPRSKP